MSNELCKGCRTYIPVEEICALGIKDVDECPCPVCLVKSMCKVICDTQYDLLMKEQGKILKKLVGSTRRYNA